MNRRIALIFLIPFLPLFLLAQDKKKADSLLIELKTAKDTHRVAVLRALAFYNRVYNPDSAMLFADQAIALATQTKYLEFDSWMAKGLVFYNLSKNDSAIKYFNVALPFAEESGSPKNLAAIYSNLGNVYGDIGQNKIALSYYMKSALYTEQAGQTFQAVYLQVNIGTIYSVMEQPDSALVAYENALQKLVKLDSTDEVLWIIHGNIGASFLSLGDTLKAEESFRHSLRFALRYDNHRGLASGYGNLGVIEHSKGNEDTALAYFRKALYYANEIESGQNISEISYYLGTVFSETGRYDSALHYLTTGARIAEEIGDYYLMDDAYHALSQVYTKTGNLDSAIVYYKKLFDVRDTLYNLNKSDLVDQMKVELESERRQKEIELLKEQDEKKNLILYSSIALGILVLALGILAFSRYLQKKKSAMILQKQKEEIEEQKEIIEEKNKDITDSIRYSKRIQNAILPSDDKMRDIFAQSWCCFIPKDIVSGDFYWFEQEGDYKLFAVVDCTGHGVPGALLSVVGHSILGKALTDLKLVMPDKILAFLDQEIHRTLRHRDSEDENSIQDGMDVALVCYHENSGMIYYSGAFNSMYIIRNKELTEYKSDKTLIGSGLSASQPFRLHEVKVEKGDEIILFSDGFADQFGGPFGKKLKYKPFQQMLLTASEKEMSEQVKYVYRSFEEWKKEFDQVDDVCVVAVKL